MDGKTDHYILPYAKSRHDKNKIKSKVLECHLLQILLKFTMCPKILNISFHFFSLIFYVYVSKYT